MLTGVIPVGARKCRNGSSGSNHQRESLVSSKLGRIRQSAFEQQQGVCYYCKQPVWLGEPDRFAAKYRLTPKQLAQSRCTAEHLQARKDGGRDEPLNIVAACAFCNRRRHTRAKPLSPDRFKRLVARRVQRGRWHGQEVLRKFACSTASPRNPGVGGLGMFRT